MTAEEMRTQLEEDRTSRLDELRRLRNLMADMDDAARDEFRRTLVVMTYAHFEGFCKTAMLAYVLAINGMKLAASSAVAEIIAASWTTRFARMENPNLKCDIFRRELPDDTQLHRFARRRDFVTELPGFMTTIVEIPDEVVDTESNLTPVILRKNLFRLGLRYSIADEVSPELSELLNRRNGICHGWDRKPVGAEEYARVEAAATKVMETIMLTVVEGIAKKRYETGAGPGTLMAS
jgi:hypothetical protein